ncbi:MAG TPA: extracellular solute-binding protein [Candidatus Acidoferrales bacterium]|nr:extracellular solute-binding protein [Candidatus Acidoferrales bacterium]
MMPAGARILASLSFIGFCVIATQAFAAASPSLQKAKQDAEAKGYSFIASHDEIVANAKKEGKVRIHSSLDPNTFKPLMESFKKKYPFADIEIQEMTGTDTAQRFLLELKAGTVKNVDGLNLPEDFYADYAAHVRKIDVLGMAEQGVLKINPAAVDPDRRNAVSMGSGICAIAYNRKQLADEKAPNSWEDFLKPEFKGKKFLVDIRPYCLAALVPLMGEEWVMNYARKIKDQEPIWVRGQTRAMSGIIAGEYSLHQMTQYHSCMRAATKDVTKSLVCKIVEPVPARLTDVEGVFQGASHPHLTLLFIEHVVSPEGQKILDESNPLKSSILANGEIAKLLRGKKVSLNDFRTYAKGAGWMKMVLEAYGFPKAEVR